MSATLTNTTRVKFCGMTRLEDVIFAADLGVDALGFVCVPKSKRFVALDRLAELTQAVPPFVASVALFQDASFEQINEVLAAGQFSILQFHGAEDPTFCARFKMPYIKAIPMADAPNLLECAIAFQQSKALLLDSHSLSQVGKHGGSGQVFEWSAVPERIPQRLILAGGLSVNNVAGGIRSMRPYAVDVSSGIESAPGTKDRAKMRDFMQAVRNESNYWI